MNNTKWTWAYGDPNGNNQPISTGITYNLRFPGQYADQESGLFYNMNRYYNPSIGRYTQVDPIGLNGGINPYVYVDNNPVNAIDILGLKKIIFGSPLDGNPATAAMYQAYLNDNVPDDVLAIYAHADTTHGIALDTRSDYNTNLTEPYEPISQNQPYNTISTGLGLLHALQASGINPQDYKQIDILACNVGQTQIPSELAKLTNIPVVATPDYVLWGRFWGENHIITMGTVVKPLAEITWLNSLYLKNKKGNWITYK